MEIKETSKLKQGDIISYMLRIEAVLDNNIYQNTKANKYKKVNIQAEEIYPHFVRFRVLEPPYMIINITNNELYQRGVYNESDFVKPFRR